MECKTQPKNKWSKQNTLLIPIMYIQITKKVMWSDDDCNIWCMFFMTDDSKNDFNRKLIQKSFRQTTYLQQWHRCHGILHSKPGSIHFFHIPYISWSNTQQKFIEVHIQILSSNLLSKHNVMPFVPRSSTNRIYFNFIFSMLNYNVDQAPLLSIKKGHYLYQYCI